MITRFSSNNENILNKRTIYLCDELNPIPLLPAKEGYRVNNREATKTDITGSIQKSESYIRPNPNACKYNYANNYADDTGVDLKRYHAFPKNNHTQRYYGDNNRTNRPWKAIYRK